MVYPDDEAGRSRWILERRGARPDGDVWRAHGWFIESERAANGLVGPVLTALLRSRECPWRCVMCDLWKFTVNRPIPPGAITAQLEGVLAEAQQDSRWPEVRGIKLYNGGSFFDAGAVPPADDAALAGALRRLDRVIVECHPALVNARAARFRDELERKSGPGREPRLEVAMGLETVHPTALERLNKRMSLDRFRRAAGWLQRERIALRVFVLIQPPFVPEAEALDWAGRSVAFALDCGATVVSLIPTRPGNGALEALAAQGDFSMPRLATLEAALAIALARGGGRIFADLWDLGRFSDCPVCFPARRARLELMNWNQTWVEPVVCASCGVSSGGGQA
jgi:archaeosine synthase beta-subunit